MSLYQGRFIGQNKRTRLTQYKYKYKHKYKYTYIYNFEKEFHLKPLFGRHTCIYEADIKVEPNYIFCENMH